MDITKQIKHWIIIAVTLVLLHQISFAQGCCSVSSPSIGITEQGVNKKGQIFLGVLYDYSKVSQPYLETKKTNDPENRATTIQKANLQIAYGLTQRLSVNLITGFQRNSRMLSLTGFDNRVVPLELFAQGIGDAILLGKYALQPLDIVTRREITFGAGMKIPTGSYKKEQDNTLLPIDLQPGTGSFSGIITAYLYQAISTLPVAVFGNTLFQLNGRNTEGYHVGNELNYSLGLIHQNCVTASTDLFLQIKGRYAQKDQLNDRILQATGGQWLYAVPGANIRLFKSISTTFSANIPIYRNVNGLQVTPTYGLSGLLAYSF